MRVEFPNCRLAETRSISRRVRTPRDAYEGYLAARRRSSAYSACSLAILHSNSLPRACSRLQQSQSLQIVLSLTKSPNTLRYAVEVAKLVRHKYNACAHTEIGARERVPSPLPTDDNEGGLARDIPLRQRERISTISSGSPHRRVATTSTSWPTVNDHSVMGYRNQMCALTLAPAR